MTPCLTIAELNRFGPCPESGRRVRALLRKLNNSPTHCFTAAEAREAGCTFNDILWAADQLANKDAAVVRRLRLFTADCAARVLHIFERDHPNDDTPRKAIKAARDYANGRISAAALAAARDAAWAAAADADATRAAALAAARAAARDAATAATRAATRAATATKDAAWDAAWDVDATRAAEEQWQFDRLIAWLSGDGPRPLRLPAKPKVPERLTA